MSHAKTRIKYLLTIKEICDQHLWASPSEIAHKLNKSPNTVSNVLRRLIKRGFVEKGTRGLYRLTEDAINYLKILGYIKREV